jgi:hypothetical protein
VGHGRRGLGRELLDPRFYLAARRIYGDVGSDPAAFETRLVETP